MGLDMFLYKKTYVKHWDYKGDGNYKVEVSKAGQPVNINPKKIAYIVEEVGYWRKANAIHKWFVDNVQKGNDDCGSYYVDREDLKNLLELCKQVEADHSKAEELLPSQSGFFFGSTDYDEWYYQDISDTKEIILECLSDETADHFEYSSSW